MDEGRGQLRSQDADWVEDLIFGLAWMASECFPLMSGNSGSYDATED